MKKAISAILSVVIMLTLAFLTMTSSLAASSSNKNSVYQYLTSQIGFNNAAACGIMANIEHESNFDPTIVARDRNGRLSGGLCMWNGGRFSNMKSFCNKNGYDYRSIKGQLKYLEHELKSDYYRHIYNYLMNVPNTKDGAYSAAYYWCYYFEIPSNRSSSSVKRGNAAKNSYWPVYGKQTLKSVTLSSPASDKTVDLSKTVTFSWKTSGAAADKYVLYIAKKVNGSYDWKNAKKVTLSASKSSYSFKSSTGKAVNYGAYIVASTAVNSVKSNTVKFTVKCLDHSYKSSVIKKATATTTGIRKYTCKKCGYSYQKSIPKIKSTGSKAYDVTGLKVLSATGTSIKLKWNSCKVADGYEVYRLSGEKWVKIKSLSSKTTEINISGLSWGKVYKFKVRSFHDNNGKTVFSKFTAVEAATKTKTPYIRAVYRPEDGVAQLTWNKVSGADNYVIYISDSKNGKYKR